MDLSQPVLTLQLRVLAGLHEGAVVPLHGLGALTLAPDAQADVLLRDAPGAAELLPDESRWLWRESGFEQAIEPGQAWRWSTVVLALSVAQEPWPDALPALAFERDPQALRTQEAPQAPAPAEVDAVAPPTEAQPEEPALPPELPSEPAAEPAAPALAAAGDRRKAIRLALAALALALLILGSLLALVLGRSPPAPVVAADAAAAAAPPVSLEQAQKLLLALDLGASVKARVREDGRLILRGVVPDAEQLDALGQAVSRLTRRHTLLVLTQAEFEARVGALAPNLPEGIAAQAELEGLLVLQARRESVDWVLARQLVEGELPEAVAIEHRPLRQEREWVDTRQARLAAAPPVRAARPPAAPPVAWAAVVGGPRPYLVMPDGSKWLPGGKINALVLLSIDERSVVVQDERGQTFTLPR